jgi:protein-S-isoprenylcysteine O-methyltransferase Ste14
MFGTKSILLRIPPGIYFVVAFVIGFVVDAFYIRSPHIPMPDDPLFWIGLGLVLPAGYFGMGGLCLFLIRRMPLMPGDPTTRLATNGPFAFSRNPMYLGLALLYAGLSLSLGLPVTTVLLLVPVLVMQLVIIPYEEHCMAETFGEAFAAYCRKVRRWI